MMSKIDKKLEKFAEQTPPKGMHLSYLAKAQELLLLYGEMSSIMEGERTTQSEEQIKDIESKIEEIVG